jgi:hypothetical protein
MATFGVIAGIVHEPETWTAAAFGLIPLSIGIGYLLDFTITRREAQFVSPDRRLQTLVI